MKRNPNFRVFHVVLTNQEEEGKDMAIASALPNWMRALVSYVRSGEPDLTNRQMALMLITYITPGPHTVRGLAQQLNVSKPVITRALNTLGSLGYLRRERDDSDRRNIFVAKTEQGAAFLDTFGKSLDFEKAGSR